jgi:hypothetical protein
VNWNNVIRDALHGFITTERENPSGDGGMENHTIDWQDVLALLRYEAGNYVDGDGIWTIMYLPMPTPNVPGNPIDILAKAIYALYMHVMFPFHPQYTAEDEDADDDDLPDWVAHNQEYIMDAMRAIYDEELAGFYAIWEYEDEERTHTAVMMHDTASH